mmetsp:Transcript_98127/g.247624  ORF Transcript_98127/g.247624 Transcript_98127/m.247624 type:complete len:683 (+) Transcript_98127:46-2094(+)
MPSERGAQSVCRRLAMAGRRMSGRRGTSKAVLGLVVGGAAGRVLYVRQGEAFAPSLRPAGSQQVADLGPDAAVAASLSLRGASATDAAGSQGSARHPTSAALVCCGVLGAGTVLAHAATRRRPRITVAAAGTTGSAVSGQDDDSTRAQRASVRRATATATETQLVTDVNPLDGPDGTYQVGIDFGGWLQSAQEEVEAKNLRVEGKLPAWLRGSLVHAGPAKFEFGDDEFVDWVDGQAMLYRVRFLGEGKCEYRNQWLDTSNHRAHRTAGRIAVRETCSRPTLPNPLDRFMYMFEPPNNENGNLHISKFAGGKRCCSMSVGSSLLEFTLTDMKTLGKVNFNDELCEGGPLIFHAEPHVDPVTGEWFTCAIQLVVDLDNFGLKPEYVVYSIEPTAPQEPGAELARRLITRIETEHPSPVHTIALTQKYIVMIQIPYPLNWDGMLNAEKKWLLTGEYEGNLNDYNTWEPHRPTLIRLIDRVTGEQVAPFEADPFFFFHVINAFEEEDVVTLDVVCYNEPPVGFPLRQAKSGDVEDWRGGGGEVRRFKMNVATGELTCTGWPDNCFDEPKVNPKVDGVRHRYSFGVIDDNGMLRLTKQDHETHEVVKWSDQDVSRELPWQPVFVPEPYNEREDAGVLLSFVRDQPTGNTFCVVVNTETMKECARIHFPEGHHIPLHGHGTWMQGDL